MLDKLAKKKVIHKNKANNLKSKLALHVNSELIFDTSQTIKI